MLVESKHSTPAVYKSKNPKQNHTPPSPLSEITKNSLHLTPISNKKVITAKEIKVAPDDDIKIISVTYPKLHPDEKEFKEVDLKQKPIKKEKERCEKAYELAQSIDPLDPGFLRIAKEIKCEAFRQDLWIRRKKRSLSLALESFNEFDIKEKKFLEKEIRDIARVAPSLFFKHAEKFRTIPKVLLDLAKDFASSRPKELMENLEKFSCLVTDEFEEIEEILKLLAHRLEPRFFSETFCKNKFPLQSDLLEKALGVIVDRITIAHFYKMTVHIASLHGANKFDYGYRNHREYFNKETQNLFLKEALDLIAKKDARLALDNVETIFLFTGMRAYPKESRFPHREENPKACTNFVLKCIQGLDEDRFPLVSGKFTYVPTLPLKNQQKKTYDERTKVLEEQSHLMYHLAMQLNPRKKGFAIFSSMIPHQNIRQELWRILRGVDLLLAYDEISRFEIINDEVFLEELIPDFVKTPHLLKEKLHVFVYSPRYFKELAQSLAINHPRFVLSELSLFAKRLPSSSMSELLVTLSLKVSPKEFCLSLIEKDFSDYQNEIFLVPSLENILRALGTQKMYKLVKYVARLSNFRGDHEGIFKEKVDRLAQHFFIEVSLKLIAHADPKLIMMNFQTLSQFIGGFSSNNYQVNESAIHSRKFPMRKKATLGSKESRDLVQLCNKAARNHKHALMLEASPSSFCSIQ